MPIACCSAICPGSRCRTSFSPRSGDLFWTPADWAWIGGLLDVLLPAWHHGVPVVAHRMVKFDPERAYRLIGEHGVRNLFLPPTACKLMRQVEPPAALPVPLPVRTVGSGGETVGAELLDWGRRVFGTTINEFYGQTECNLVVSSCAAVMAPRPGAIGRAVPGHRVAVVDRAGQPVRDGALGVIAVARPDPVMFLGYWGNPQATAEKFVGDWLLTGDQGRRDPDGYFWFVGRDDDVITSGGYRIGPRRDRGLPDQASGGRDGGGDRRARCAAHRDRQGVRRAQAGSFEARAGGRSRPRGRAAGLREDPAGRP